MRADDNIVDVNSILRYHNEARVTFNTRCIVAVACSSGYCCEFFLSAVICVADKPTLNICTCISPTQAIYLNKIFENKKKAKLVYSDCSAYELVGDSRFTIHVIGTCVISDHFIDDRGVSANRRLYSQRLI